MKCSTCGKLNLPEAHFCEECGNPLLNKPEITATKYTPPVNRADISLLRHPKESFYFIIGAIFGVIIWIFLIWVVIVFLTIALPVIIILWLIGEFQKAKLIGNAVKVSKSQYPEIYEIIANQCHALSINHIPEAFIVNEKGNLNAFALKTLTNKYIILNSSIIDTMLAHNSFKELSFVIGHELAHHAAGHLSYFKKFLLFPTRIIPFFGSAYSRACELTADRIGMYLCGDKVSSLLALVTLACGSEKLSHLSNIESFMKQEELISKIFLFLHDLFSTHPRLTKRVSELKNTYL